MAGTNRNISVRAVGDFSNLSQGLQRAQTEIQSFGDRVRSKFKEIGEVGLGLFEVFEVFKQIGESVSELANRAAELDGGMSSLNRTLGQSAIGYMDWANTTAKSFGISQMSAVEYGKGIAMLLADVYKNQTQLAAATEKLMQGGAVIAAKTGKSQQEVYEDLNSALMGHAAAVKSLDINVMENALVHSQAYKQIANGAPWAKLTVAQQQYIRVTELNRQIQQKFGDTIGTGMDARLMLFKMSLDNLQTSLAQAFMPILYRILPILNTFMNWISTAVSYVAAFFQVLFGYTGIQAGMTSAVNQQAQAVNALGNAYTTAGNKASAAHKAISGATHNAGIGGAKNGRNTLNHNGIASFDQVHTLTKNSNATSSGGGAFGGAGAVDPTSGLGDMNNALNGVGNNAKLLADNLARFRDKVKGFAEGIRNFFLNIGNFIKEHKALMETVVGALIGLLVGLGAAFAVIGFASIASFLEVIGVGFATLIGPILLVGVAIGALTGLFVGLYKNNKTFRDDVIAMWDDIKKAVESFWKDVVVPTADFLIGAFQKAWVLIQEAMVSVNKNAIQPLFNFLNDLWHNVLSPLANVLKEDLTIAFGVLEKAAKEFWQYVMIPLANMLKTNFKPAVEAISAVLKVLWKDVIVPIALVIGVTLYEALKTAGDAFVWFYRNVIKPNMPLIKNVVDDTFSYIREIINSLSSVLNGVLNFITGVFTGNWRKAWSGLKEIIGSIFSGIWDVVKYPLNLIIDAVNSLIRGLDKLKINIPSWVPGLGGQSYGINIPTIPHLANGGITNGPTLAMIGDNPGGQEVVSPLDKLAGMITSSMIHAIQMTKVNNSNNVGGDIVLNLDGRTFARIIKPYADLENKRVGTNIRLQSI